MAFPTAMTTLSTISNVATVGDFLLAAVPQAKSLLGMYRGTNLQEPAEILAFILSTVDKCSHLFTVSELDELMRIYADLRKGIMAIKAGKIKAPKAQNEQAAAAAKELVFKAALKKVVNFFKASERAVALAELTEKAEKWHHRAVELSDRAKFRRIAKERNERAAGDGGAGSLWNLQGEFTASQISLLFNPDGHVSAGHLDARTQSLQTTTSPTQPPQTPSFTQTPQATAASTQTHQTTAVSAPTPPATAASTQTTPATAAVTEPPTGRNPFEDEQYYVALALSSRNSATSLSSLYTTCSTWASTDMHVTTD